MDQLRRKNKKSSLSGSIRFVKGSQFIGNHHNCSFYISGYRGELCVSIFIFLSRFREKIMSY